MTVVTSVRSGPVARARRLLKRALREADGRFLAEGPQAVSEALAAHVEWPDRLVAQVFVESNAHAKQQELAHRARELGIETLVASPAVMASLSGTVTPQGIVAVCAMLPTSESVLPVDGRLWACLAQVRDPGNAGTVIRVADAAGADAVCVSRGSVDVFNGKSVRASAGSLFHVPICAGLAEDSLVQMARDRGMQVWAADASGQDLGDIPPEELASPTMWVFGNEAWGLPEELVQTADRAVAVPIHGRAESLNLATAAAVCLYASASAQRRHGPH